MDCSIARKWRNVNMFFEKCFGRGQGPCFFSVFPDGQKKVGRMWFVFVEFCGIDRLGGGGYNRFIWKAIHLICGRSAESSGKYKIEYGRMK